MPRSIDQISAKISTPLASIVILGGKTGCRYIYRDYPFYTRLTLGNVLALTTAFGSMVGRTEAFGARA